MLRKQDADILVWLTAIFAFTLVYLWNPPGPRYYPIEGIWSWDTIEGQPSMGWYARLAYALIAAVISAIPTWFISQKFIKTDHVLTRKIIYTSTIALTLLLLFAFAYIAYHEFSHLSHS